MNLLPLGPASSLELRCWTYICTLSFCCLFPTSSTDLLYLQFLFPCCMHAGWTAEFGLLGCPCTTCHPCSWEVHGFGSGFAMLLYFYMPAAILPFSAPARSYAAAILIVLYILLFPSATCCLYCLFLLPVLHVCLREYTPLVTTFLPPAVY